MSGVEPSQSDKAIDRDQSNHNEEVDTDNIINKSKDIIRNNDAGNYQLKYD